MTMRWRFRGVVVVALAFAIVLGACGGAASPGVASAGSSARSATTHSTAASRPSKRHRSSSTTTTPSAATGNSASVDLATKMLEFAQCMRAHGVSDFPDPVVRASIPPVGSKTFLGNGPNPSTSPIYRAASAACRRYAVAEPVTPAVATRVQAEQLRYAECLRAHGEPDFPDPSANGGFPIPKSLDENSPTFRSAERACQDVQPTLPGPSGFAARG